MLHNAFKLGVFIKLLIQIQVCTVYETEIINKCVKVLYIRDSALGHKKYTGNTRYAFSPCIHHRTKSEGPAH